MHGLAWSVSQTARQGEPGCPEESFFLKLTKRTLGDAGVLALAHQVATSGVVLLRVNIAESGVGDKGVGALGAVLAGARTGVLNLAKNRVADGGCAVLMAALHGSVLCELNLSFNVLGSAGKLISPSPCFARCVSVVHALFHLI